MSAMISATRDWFKRNRTNFAVGASVLGAGYVATQYVVSKITEARQRMSDERIAKENLRRRFSQNQEDCTFTVLAILPTATENILQALPVEATLAELQRQKAERLAKSIGAPTESDAISTVPSLTTDANFEENKSTVAGSDSFVHTSQVVQSSSGGETVGNGEVQNKNEAQPATPALAASPKPKKSKLQLWNEVKIDSITRAFSLLYTLALLTLLTRIQLNLLGRRTYLASVVSLASPASSTSAPHINLENRDDDNYEQSYGNDFETNRKYLSFSWWLLHRGSRSLITLVSAAVREVFDPIQPREDLTLSQLSALTRAVRLKIEGSTPADRRSKSWLPYLLPSASEGPLVLQSTSPSLLPPSQTTISPSLRRLLDETSDLVDSPPFTHVLTLLLDVSFSHLIDAKLATQAYHLPPVSPSPARIQELIDPDTAKAKVANSLAVFCRAAHSIGAGESNEYLSKMETVSQLEAFAAVVYSSNFGYESARTEEGALVKVGDEVGIAQRMLEERMDRIEDEDFLDLGTSRPNTAEMAEDELEKVWEEGRKMVQGNKANESQSAPLVMETESTVVVADSVETEKDVAEEQSVAEPAVIVTSNETVETPKPSEEDTAMPETKDAITENGTTGSLESAWEKALKKEDGKLE